MLISSDGSRRCGRTVVITHENTQELQGCRVGNHTVGISGPFEALTCITSKCLRCLRNAENVVLNFPYSHSSLNGNK